MRRRIRAWLHWAFISEEGTRTVTAVAGVVAVVGVIATVVGLYIAVQQLSDLPDQRDMRGASIVMAVDQQLSAEHLRPVRRAIMKGQSLNDYDPDDLEDYLDILEGLAINYERHLVDFDTVDNWHGDTILKTYRHPGVRQFIREQHRDDPDYYAELVALGEKVERVNTRSERPVLRRAPAK